MNNMTKVSDFEMMLLKSAATLEQSGKSTMEIVDTPPSHMMEKVKEMVPVFNKDTKRNELIPGFRSVYTNWLYYAELVSYPVSFKVVEERANSVTLPLRMSMVLNSIDSSNLSQYLGCSKDNNFFSHLLMGSVLYSWSSDCGVSIKRYTRSGFPLGEYCFKITPIVQTVAELEINEDRTPNRFVHSNFTYTIIEPKRSNIHVHESWEVSVILSKSRQSKEGSNSESRKKGTPLETESDEQAELEL